MVISNNPHCYKLTLLKDVHLISSRVLKSRGYYTVCLELSLSPGKIQSQSHTFFPSIFEFTQTIEYLCAVNRNILINSFRLSQLKCGIIIVQCMTVQQQHFSCLQVLYRTAGYNCGEAQVHNTKNQLINHIYAFQKRAS